QHRLDEVAPFSPRAGMPEEARHPHDQRPRAGLSRKTLAGQLGDPIDVDGARAVVLGVRGSLQAVKHIVRADMDVSGAGFGTGPRDMQGAERVHPESLLGALLALVDAV